VKSEHRKCVNFAHPSDWNSEAIQTGYTNNETITSPVSIEDLLKAIGHDEDCRREMSYA
jgi:hypothetical protein